MTLKNAVSHFRTVTRHRHTVIEHCAKAGILTQGLLHDLSKYSPTEFLEGVRHYQGTRSPNEHEREVRGYSLAWMHHKGRNRHHFEYWTDYNSVTKTIEPVKMPLRYAVEMFCDRVAASKIYLAENYTDREPLKYFRKGKARFRMHPETADFLEKLLKMLAKYGEDRTFAYIRRLISRNEEY